MRGIAVFLAGVFMACSAHAAAKVVAVDGDHGQKAWLIEDHTLPIVTARVEFENGGVAYDETGKEGLSYFAMQMLTEGAGDMDSLAFNRALEQHAIHIGVDAQEDATAISLQTLSEFKDNAFSLFSLAINKPRFDDDAIARVASSIASDLKEMQANPVYIASRKWKELAYPGHAYRNLRMGTPESVALIKQADLQKYAGSVLACNRRIISVVGDITVAETRKFLSTIAPAKECRPSTMPVADVQPAEGSGAPVIMKQDVPQTVVQASFPALMRNDPHYYALVLLNYVFGGGGVFDSRLGQEIRNKRGLAYDADSANEALEHSAYIVVHFGTRNEQANTAVGIFREEVEKMRDKGVTKEELDAAKRYLTGSFPLGLDSQSALTEYLTQMQRYNLGMDYLDKRNSLINAVKLSEVNDLAKTLFAHTPIIVMAGAPTNEEKKK